MNDLESGIVKVYRGGQLVRIGSFRIGGGGGYLTTLDPNREFYVSPEDIKMIERAIENKRETVQTEDHAYEIVYL